MPTQISFPKIGYTLDGDQKLAIRSFIDFCKNPKHQEFNQYLLSSLWAKATEEKPEMLTILNETFLLLTDPQQDLSFLDKTSKIKVDREIEDRLYNLFLSVQFLVNNTIDGSEIAENTRDQQTTSNMPEYLSLKQKANSLLRELSRENQSYQQKTVDQENSHKLLSEANESIVSQALFKPTLIDILFKAIHHPTASYRLAAPQVALIKDSLGQEEFARLLNRYQIKEENFNFDDLRMIIIGAVPIATNTWFENEFIRNLFICCNLEIDQYRNVAGDKKKIYIQKAAETLWERARSCKNRSEARNLINSLIQETTINPEALERIKKQPVDNIINNALHFLKYFINFIPVKCKLKTKFRRDLSFFEAITSIHNWQDKKPPEIQKFASNEFLFNKLSHVDLQEGIVVPILEADGRRIFYKVENLMQLRNIKAFALVPANPLESQEIKVVFNGYSNLAKEIINAENYMSLKDFDAHKEDFLSNLNTTTKNFKEKLAPTKKQNLCLNIGGHGFRGALAQKLMNEIIFRKAAKKYKEHPEEFDIDLYSTNQTEHETQEVGKKIKTPEKHIQKLTSVFQQKIDKHPESPNDKHLLAINNFKLSTVNSGGIPEEMRKHEFIPSLYLLKQNGQISGQPPFKIEYNKIMTEGDPVQQTGETDLAAYVPRDLMEVNLAKITPQNTQSNAQLVANMTKSAALIVIQGLLAAKLIIIPLISSFLTIKMSQEATTLTQNANQLIHQANNAHRNLYFDKTTPTQNHEIFYNNYLDEEKNTYDSSGYQLNAEVANKVRIFSSKPYKLLNTVAYKACKLLQSNTPHISTPHEEFHELHLQTQTKPTKNSGSTMLNDVDLNNRASRRKKPETPIET